MSSYPLDPPGTSYLNAVQNAPIPAYPFQHSTILSKLISPDLYLHSLQAYVPIVFSIFYYLVAHSANHIQSGRDWSKGNSFTSQCLRLAIVVHNAALCLYSGFTFLAMAPVVLDMFWQGYRAAGYQGLQVALCSMPTNEPVLGRWAYLFYLSKYYEVIDSVILFLKGKKIGNLQSYHHAGALICMWIAYRTQSQPVWVFCVFNAGVHTLMYAYYFCSALRLPFPKTLKRNLTTLQIIQIASGTIITNLYFAQSLDPAHVYSLLKRTKTTSLLPAWLFASAGELANARSTLASTLINREGASIPSTMQLQTYAGARMGYSDPSSCMERKGAVLALHVNTMYMTPLLILFANFFTKSYLRKSQAAPHNGNTTSHDLKKGRSQHNQR